MNFKKRVNGSWADIPHYIHNTSTDTITTLPAVIHPTGTTATVGLKGNAVQSSTPSSTSPVMPQGCGDLEATGEHAGQYKIPISSGGVNLCYLYKTGYRLDNAGNEVEAANFNIYTTSASANTTYTLNLDYSSVGTTTLRIIAYISGSFSYRIAEVNLNSVPYTFTTPSDCDEVKISLSNQSTNVMLNRGSTALPYEPYVQPTLSNIYLGEVETERKVRKYEFTGNEAFYASSQTSIFYTTAIANSCNKTTTYNTGCLCNAYVLRKQSTAVNLQDGEFTTDTNAYLWFRNYDYATLADFKSYLAAQYANGTPVTVWYVLANEETGIVNEPLMRIGNYADEVSGIAIPVAAGGDTLSVGTTVQPSEVTVNYKGWHPVSAVHERDNGQWD